MCLIEQVTSVRDTTFNIPHGAYGQTIGTQENLNSLKEDPKVVFSGETVDVLTNDGLQTQDSFGKWMSYIIADSPGSVDDSTLECSMPSGYHQSTVPDHIFNITDVSPTQAYSTEKTKVLLLSSVPCLLLLHR